MGQDRAVYRMPAAPVSQGKKAQNEQRTGMRIACAAGSAYRALSIQGFANPAVRKKKNGVFWAPGLAIFNVFRRTRIAPSIGNF
jgi:hypothetical protein